VEKWKEGDRVCIKCGEVAEEKMISEEAEYRLFNEDSESQKKVRVGQAMSIYMLHDQTTWSSKLAPDDRDFLYTGWRNIDRIINSLFVDSQPAVVRSRAKELFQEAFLLQVHQKEGKKAFNKPKAKAAVRQKFARRKPFVVASVFVALKEHGLDHLFEIRTISEKLDGADVSRHTLKKCMRELGLNQMWRKVDDVKREVKEEFRAAPPSGSRNFGTSDEADASLKRKRIEDDGGTNLKKVKMEIKSEHEASDSQLSLSDDSDGLEDE
tara:strand:- start:475 stop:1275 length:801 start_codon:yes stop_codon:yes gene_type:complete